MSQTLPPPLPAHAIGVLLQYIVPPSQVTQPLPPHLLSRDLLQRHHFLSLRPDEPADYLCWPAKGSSTGPSAVDLLESLPRPDDGAPPPPIAYTSDDEHAYAHALLDAGPPLSGRVRIVFQWDESEHSWRYHDTSTAPLTVSSDQPVGALQPLGAEDKMALERTPMVAPRESPAVRVIGEEDDYWNAYGHDNGSGNHSPRSLKRNDSVGDDAYWAQYSSVQGTADSTIPSPLPIQKRQHGQPRPNPYTGSQPQSGYGSGAHSGAHSGTHSAGPPSRPNEVIDGTNHPIPIPLYGGAFAGAGTRPRGFTNGDPPSPRSLRTLLQALPPRTPGETPEHFEHAEAEGGAEVAVPANGASRTPTPPLPVKAAINGAAEGKAVNGVSQDDSGLKLVLGGLYAMWQAGRRSRGVDAAKDAETFLHEVKTIVEKS